MRSRIMLIILITVLLGFGQMQLEASSGRLPMLEYAYQYIQFYYVDEIDHEEIAQGIVDGVQESLADYQEKLEPSDWEQIMEKLENTSTRSLFYPVEQVIKLIEEDYTHLINPDKIIDGAFEGMMGALDIYSRFMTADEYEEMQQEMEGEYGGIGIIITLRDEKTTVVETFEGGPGYRAGLKTGDIIREVDGESTEGLMVQDVSTKIRGEVNTTVTLTIYRPSTEEEFEVDIGREIIEMPTVTSEMVDEKTGLIDVMQFVERTGEKVAREISNLKEEGAEKFILDLRGNPGGLLREAVNVASQFIPSGPVVHVADRSGIQEVLNTNPQYDPLDLPLVVLIDLGSASGSEIVAAGIQEHEAGTLLGETTFGKGTVQSILPLPDGSALRLTTARYYTSKENSIHEKGVEPDIFVETSEDFEEDDQLDEAIEYLRENY